MSSYRITAPGEKKKCRSYDDQLKEENAVRRAREKFSQEVVENAVWRIRAEELEPESSYDEWDKKVEEAKAFIKKVMG